MHGNTAPGRSGAELGSENLAKVTETAARLLGLGPAERVAGQINKQWFSREAGVDPQCLKQSRNPRCAEVFASYDADDKVRWLTRLEMRELEADQKLAGKRQDELKDDLILTLRAENASLKADLDGLRALQRLMADTGRMP